jgi:hypothetical protein
MISGCFLLRDKIDDIKDAFTKTTGVKHARLESYLGSNPISVYYHNFIVTIQLTHESFHNCVESAHLVRINCVLSPCSEASQGQSE